MPNLAEGLQQFLESLNPSRLPSPAAMMQAMDPVAWVLVALLAGAVVVGVVFSVTTRRSFLRPDAHEYSPALVLARLKQDPTRLPPVSIISRLGSEATLELLEFGDQIRTNEWRYRWNSVREELLRLLAQQKAFGPTHALARYYRADRQTRTRHPAYPPHGVDSQTGRSCVMSSQTAGGNFAELRVRAHPAEVEGDLGFEGETRWLLPEEPAPPVHGPLLEMEPIDFRTLQDVEVRLNIRRSPTVGGGFRLTLTSATASGSWSKKKWSG